VDSSEPPIEAPAGTTPSETGAQADTRATAPRQPMDDRERRLHPRIVTIWRAMAALFIPFLVVPPTIVAGAVLGPPGLVLGGIAVVLAIVLVVWYPRARFDAWRWRLTPLALELRHGVLVRRHQAIPYFRIQQIDIAQGPLDRAADLATLQVTTASSSGGAALPGIAETEAPTVRGELLERAAEAVGEHVDDMVDAV
jgi:uncharacterized protein